MGADAVFLGLTFFGPSCVANPPADDGKLRIIVFGAHPDDAEFKAGGVAAMWAAQGHHVKFVSMTNGDWGARNCEIHFCQVRGQYQPFKGINFPTFILETA